MIIKHYKMNLPLCNLSDSSTAPASYVDSFGSLLKILHSTFFCASQSIRGINHDPLFGQSSAAARWRYCSRGGGGIQVATRIGVIVWWSCCKIGKTVLMQFGSPSNFQ